MYHLSKPQKSIYNMEKFAGGTIAVICSSILRKGTTNADTLKKAVNELYRINEALRIQISESADGPVQSVVEYAERDFEICTFESREDFYKYASDYSREALNIYEKLSDIKIVFFEKEYGLLVKLHHIIGDAWTMALLANQLAALLDNKDFKAYSYSDYLGEEEAYTQSRRYQSDRQFFISQFGKCSEAVYLTDKQSDNYSTGRYTVELTKEQTKRISDLAEENNSSIFAVIMTLFCVYFSRIKMNAEKFYIGTPVINRRGIKEQNTAGMFVNVVPFLAEIDSMQTFKENLIRSTDGIMALLRHQHYNYEDFLSELRKEYNFTEKLYDVIVSCQNARIYNKDFWTEWYDCGMQTESLQIHVDDRNDRGKLTVNYDYRKDKFTAEEIKRMHEYMSNLFRDAVNNENKKIYELNILSDAEKNKLLYEFNDTKAEYPKDKCIYQLFEERAAETPDKVAVTDCEKTITYDELNKLANRIAHALIVRNIGRGDVVAFSLSRRDSLIAVMLGILKSGAAYMPIGLDYPKERVEYMLQESRAVLYITDEILKRLLENTNTHNPDTLVHQDDIYCVLHTSGSTGTPKLSLLNHKNLMAFLILSEPFYNNVKTVVSATIITFDVFIMESIVPLSKGIHVRLISEDEIYDQYKFENAFADYSNIMFFSTPTKIKTYIENSKTKEFMRHISSCVVGGEVVSNELYNLIKSNTSNCNVFVAYGPTETTIWSTSDMSVERDVTIGKPGANTQIYILDKYNNILPTGCVGELCIAGDGVGAGYLNHSELTEEKFIKNPFGEEKMYRTGDLAYWRGDGKIMFVGRNDFQVKIRGLRIELGEIESAINSVDGVSQSVTVVRRDKSGRQLICAFYTKRREVDIEDIKKRILDRLPKYMLPHIFVHLDEMPLTPSGKINRKALPDVDLENISSKSEYIKPQTEMQRRLADIMGSVLEAPLTGMKDNFFDMGGDSLKAIEFVSKAHSEGIYFNLQALFDNPTLEGLCSYIESSNKTEVKYSEKEFAGINSVLAKNTLTEIDACKAEAVPMGDVMITGTTGYLGIHILADFLDNDTGIAYCPVRGDNETHSKERLAQMLKFYFGDKYSDLIDTRIRVLCADLSKENMGLSRENYIYLQQNVYIVINAAASVKHYGSYKYFYEANVESVKNLIRFCMESDACMIHASTLSVSGNSFGDEFDGYISDTEKHFYESSLYIGQSLENVYAHSKFEAEKEILSAMAKGLKANIMRMGNLTNRLADGRFQKNHESNAFLKHVSAILNLGLFPEYLMHIYAEFTPVDEAARAVMTIVRHFSKEQTVFHINSPKVVYAEKLIEYFGKNGINIQITDEQTFTDALRQTVEQADKEFIYETFINEMDNASKLNYDSNIHIENDFTIKYLQNLGFEWSDIDEEYIRKYVGYFRKIGYLEV